MAAVSIGNATSNTSVTAQPASSGIMSSDQYDKLLSYFEKITETREAALQITTAIIKTAQQNNIAISVIIDQFSKMPKGDLNPTLAFILNDQRFNSSFLGVRTASPTSKYVARTILQ